VLLLHHLPRLTDVLRTTKFVLFSLEGFLIVSAFSVCVSTWWRLVLLLQHWGPQDTDDYKSTFSGAGSASTGADKGNMEC